MFFRTQPIQSVSGNTIHGNNKITRMGLNIASGRYNTVIGNVIDECEYGVYIYKTSSGLASEYNIVANNVIRACDYGIRESNTDDANHNIISNNDCGSCVNPYSLRGGRTSLIYNAGLRLKRADDDVEEDCLYFRSDLAEWRVKVGNTPYRVNLSPV